MPSTPAGKAALKAFNTPPVSLIDWDDIAAVTIESYIRSLDSKTLGRLLINLCCHIGFEQVRQAFTTMALALTESARQRMSQTIADCSTPNSHE